MPVLHQAQRAVNYHTTTAQSRYETKVSEEVSDEIEIEIRRGTFPKQSNNLRDRSLRVSILDSNGNNKPIAIS